MREEFEYKWFSFLYGKKKEEGDRNRLESVDAIAALDEIAQQVRGQIKRI
ncbi:hypothetical protein H6G00_19875 [Leptolyngbya sp. FACHB-541]|nr:hypothetical protein [Leptolyngbya sp. FACHB-541]MBD1998852.1 hypothetical protein [Leptolyngbya sp. FACHB-541]